MIGDYTTLAQIDQFVAQRAGPFVVPDLPLRPGGVDPLGLRQLNFDLMDRCIPGLNNAAWRLRPYGVVAWAWWRAAQIAAEAGLHDPPVEVLKSFVDRVETLFAAGHLMANEFDGLPGSDTLNTRVVRHGGYDFASTDWQVFRYARRDTTSLMAPVAYGPSAKEGPGLGYLRVVGGAFAPVEEVMPAVLALDRRLQPIASHPALSSLEHGWVSTEQMAALHPYWQMDDLEGDEVTVGTARLLKSAPRLATIRMIVDILAEDGSFVSTDELRRRAALETAGGGATAKLWRALQARQLMRISLEGLLSWVLLNTQRPRSLESLVEELSEAVGGQQFNSLGDWVSAPCVMQDGTDGVTSPVDLIYAIRNAVQTERPELCTMGFRAAIQICRSMSNEEEFFNGQTDRLPLSHVCSRISNAEALPLSDGLTMLVSEWLIGQHIYWAVGRSGDDTQRLRIVLDEGGWTSTLTTANAVPTADRLYTLLELCSDCRLLERKRQAGQPNSYRVKPDMNVSVQ